MSASGPSGPLVAIYDRGKGHIQIVHPHVQQQTNGVDCGIFAIAYATEFIFNQYIGYDWLNLIDLL